MKVGDFGLSRESSSVGSITAFDDSDDDKNDTNSSAVDTLKGLRNAFRGDDENTAGVGTQAVSHPNNRVLTPFTNFYKSHYSIVHIFAISMLPQSK